MVKKVNLDIDPGEIVQLGMNEGQYYIWTGEVLEQISLDEKRVAIMTAQDVRWETVLGSRRVGSALKVAGLSSSNAFGDGTLLSVDTGTETRDIDMSESSAQGKQIITHKKVYFMAETDPFSSPSLRGHGGAEFLVYMNDGKKLTTNDLWYNKDREEGDGLVENAITVESSFNPVAYYTEGDTLALVVPKFMFNLFLEYQPRENMKYRNNWLKVLQEVREKESPTELVKAVIVALHEKLVKDKNTKVNPVTYGEEDYEFMWKIFYGPLTEDSLKDCYFNYSITPFQSELRNLKKNYLGASVSSRSFVFNLETDYLRDIMHKASGKF